MIQLIHNIDNNLLFALNSLAGRADFSDLAIIFLAKYMAYILPVVFLVCIYRSKIDLNEKYLITSISFFAALVARFVVEPLIHLFYFRPRPFLVFHIHQLLPENTYSFPSGHASFFFAFSFAIYFYNKKWGTWFLIASAILTLARVAAGIHYPTDIFGGFVIGLAIASFSYKYLNRPFRNIIGKYT